MRMSAIKPLRLGSAYLPGVIEAGVRPFRYRRALQRLLSGRADGPTLRMIYRNGFLPVNFNYLSPVYYDYNHEDSLAPWSVAERELSVAQREKPALYQREDKTVHDTAMQNFSMLAESGQIALPRDTASARIAVPAAISPQREVMSLTLPGISRVTTLKPDVDLKSRDASDVSEASEVGASTSPTKTLQELMAAFLAAPVPQGAAHVQPQTRALSKREQLIAQLQARRSPEGRSLNELAKQLEQANFGEAAQKRAQITHIVPSSNATGGSFMPAARLSRLLNHPQTTSETQTYSESLDAPRMAAREEWKARRARKTHSEHQSVTAQLDTALRHYPQRSKKVENEKASSTKPAQPEAASVAPAPLVKQSNRVVRVSDATTPAIWERSYLPHLELRLYR